ncbi:ABC transporter ATP-binding protein [Paucibacter aquatile]|uniref:ABC transporter ATP-binding protein n=1 Tax=Kinneretia aquatilis TaxID=2070761 RepID=A0A2N8KS10_9BURK|nr:ABC transporter ATP-binding protein [Paucibacter aquatile]PND36220.1 ABC transporter ATP-binding protein [Paucibacter aquatile]
MSAALQNTGPMLQVERLCKRFGALAATDEASFALHRGEIHALIGPNGAGKTTLIHQLSGALRPDSGRVLLDGQDLTPLGMAGRVAAGLVRSFQITSIFKRLSVRDNIALGLQARRPGLPNLWRRASAERALQEQAEALLELCGLAARADELAGSLAHGEQRQLEVGLALAAQPRLLLLDEPMAGMGPDESERMVLLLQRLRAEQGLTLLLVEHDMDAVFRLADRISTLVFGRIIASGTPQEIREHPEVRRAYLGDEASDEMEAAL